MTLFVNKKIRKFRFAKKMSQEKLAAAIGCPERRLCEIELGDVYPRSKEIEKINELGAGIHPSIFSPVIQKIIKATRKKNPTRSFNSVETTKKERLWIKKQLQKKGLHYCDIAEIAKCKPNTVYSVLAGYGKSKVILGAFAEALGYKTIEELLNASRIKEAA
jgi:transcriptional regulator with XRE-family HTH domain